jgi:hypothetical protein
VALALAQLQHLLVGQVIGEFLVAMVVLQEH